MSFFQNKKSFKEKFPDGYEHLKGSIVPFWDNILLYSSQIQFYTGLGYLALDWVITKNGPKLLEINARAGLEIQNVNLVPLAKRLEQVDDLKIKSPEKGVEIAKSLFHSAVSSGAVGKKIIRFAQQATIRGIEIMVKVDPNQQETAISVNLKKYFSRDSVIQFADGVQLSLGKIEKILDHNEKNLVILGQADLADCLIAPTILAPNTHQNSRFSSQIHDIDDKMHTLARKLNLSSILRPQNYSAELHNFLNNPHEYNPTFEYKFPTEEIFADIDTLSADLENEISLLSAKDSTLQKLFSEKLQELCDRKNLILAYKNSDYPKIAQYNTKLFGAINTSLLEQASKKVFEKSSKKSQNSEKILGKILSLDEIQVEVENFLKSKNIE